jgi:hypothetical protein
MRRTAALLLLAIIGCSDRTLHDSSDAGVATDLAVQAPADLAPADGLAGYACKQSVDELCATRVPACVRTLAEAIIPSSWCTPPGPAAVQTRLQYCGTRAYVEITIGMGGAETWIYDVGSGQLLAIFDDDDDPSNTIQCVAGPARWSDPAPFPFACPVDAGGTTLCI